MTTCTVDADHPFATINPNLYGHFAEHLGSCIYEGLWVGPDSPIPNTDGIRNDVLAALKRMKPPVIRWPGGCFADTYHWRDGVGPAESRPKRVNLWWGQVIEPNTFGTHEFIRLCRLLGAHPYVCGNVGSGSPGELSDWVEYCNHDGPSTLAEQRAADGSPEPLRVTFWGVGNENWGCGGSMDPEDYAVEYRRYATFLHELGGVPLHLIACGPSGNDPDWTRRFLAKLGRHRKLHGYAAHYYCGTAGTAVEYDDEQFLALIRRAVVKMELLIFQQRAALDSFDPERRIQLIVDEWGTWHPADPNRPPRSLWQQNTIRDALVAAGTLDLFNRHADEVQMGNIAQMVNVLQAMCLTDGDRMLVTPTGLVYELYAPHQDARVVPLAVDTDTLDFREGDQQHRLPRVDGSASIRGGEVFVTLTHRHPREPVEVTLRLRDGAAAGATCRLIAGQHIRDHNTFAEPERVAIVDHGLRSDGEAVRIELPPAAVAAVRIRR